MVRPEKLSNWGSRIIDFSTLHSKPFEGLILDTYPGNSIRLITPSGNLGTNTQVLAVHKWQRVTASYNAADGKASIYLDGKIVAEKVLGPAPSKIDTTVDSAEEVVNLSRAYTLQRYMNACAGRGNYPIKFNGSLFTVSGNIEKESFDPDYRRWGEPYWFQNTRLPYWSMPASGDLDFIKPLFKMYQQSLDFAQYRAKTFHHAEGAVYPETIMFWGTSPVYIYGWPKSRTQQNLPIGLIQHRMHRYHWTAGIELSAIMLEYYRYSEDEQFARESLLPFSNQILKFFRTHYPTGADGKLKIEPSQALESWWDTVNPMPEVAGLRYMLSGLKNLPAHIITEDQKREWNEFLEILPELPKRQIKDKPTIWVADKTPVKPRNVENPELYAIFPFKHFGVGLPDIEIAQRGFNARRVKMHSGWSQDDIQAAVLGLTNEAAASVLKRANAINPHSRFPVFWGPNYDWVPDQDHGSVLLTAVQKMLLQSNGKRLFLFPAWPKEWDVKFRLHAPGSTTIESELRDGKIVSLEVNPKHRLQDITIISDLKIDNSIGL